MSVPLLVPAYMAWCVKNADGPAELVHDYTLRSLAEFGRTRTPKLMHLNFGLACTADQRQVVAKYLRWSLNPELLLDTEQLKRALSRWSAPDVGSETSKRSLTHPSSGRLANRFVVVKPPLMSNVSRHTDRHRLCQRFILSKAQ